jgi:hypothetical protein
MIEQFKSWRVSLERLVSTPNVDWDEAVRLAVEIGSRSTDPLVRRAAGQAIPILRNAAQGDHNVRQAARRRLCVVLDALQEVTAPRFGQREAMPKPLSAEERARRVLDLPLGTQLTVPDIHRAFRRAAKLVHPDAGGSEQAFLELIAAQDVLMHPGNHKGE